MLNRHVKSKHLKIRDLKCEQCDYQTYSTYNLQKHVEVNHEKVSMACEQCNYKTASAMKFEKHMKAKHNTLRDN